MHYVMMCTTTNKHTFVNLTFVQHAFSSIRCCEPCGRCCRDMEDPEAQYVLYELLKSELQFRRYCDDEVVAELVVSGVELTELAPAVDRKSVV